MPLFRCINPDCAEDPFSPTPEYDFEDSEKTGTCPKCGSTHATNPQLVLARVAVHYLLNDPAGMILTKQGRRRVLCQPALRRLTGTHQCTGLHSAVTCPACLADPVFKAHEDHDVDQNVPSLLKKGMAI